MGKALVTGTGQRPPPARPPGTPHLAPRCSGTPPTPTTDPQQGRVPCGLRRGSSSMGPGQLSLGSPRVPPEPGVQGGVPHVS